MEFPPENRLFQDPKRASEPSLSYSLYAGGTRLKATRIPYYIPSGWWYPSPSEKYESQLGGGQSQFMQE
jgi:hypothetical protein